ncbi:hypothetical protein ACWEFL_21390 [Streptomyces sp. NPDC004838]
MDGFAPRFIEKAWTDLELEAMHGAVPRLIDRVDDLVVVGGEVGLATPGREGGGVITHGVPDGRYPVYVGLVRSGGDGADDAVQFAAYMFLIPVAGPECLITASWDEGYGDRGTDLEGYACLWSSHACRMSLPHHGEDRHEAIARAEREILPESALARRDNRINEIVDPATGANMLSFPVWDETYNGFEARGEDDELLALLFVTWSA